MAMGKKKLIVIAIACLACVCMALILFGGAGNVSGTWKVNGYEYDGVSYKASEVKELCEIRGYSLMEWSDAKLKLTKSGNVYLSREENGRTVEITGTYTAEDTFIELIAEDGEKKLLDYDGKHIYYDIPSGVTLVFQK